MKWLLCHTIGSANTGLVYAIWKKNDVNCHVQISSGEIKKERDNLSILTIIDDFYQ